MHITLIIHNLCYTYTYTYIFENKCLQRMFCKETLAETIVLCLTVK